MIETILHGTLQNKQIFMNGAAISRVTCNQVMVMVDHITTKYGYGRPYNK